MYRSLRNLVTVILEFQSRNFCNVAFNNQSHQIRKLFLNRKPGRIYIDATSKSYFHRKSVVVVVIVGIRSIASMWNLGLLGGVSIVVVFLRDPTPYLQELRRNHGNLWTARSTNATKDWIQNLPSPLKFICSLVDGVHRLLREWLREWYLL